MDTQLKGFQQTIEDYLSMLAQEDPLFAEKYGNPDKKIEDCITFIINQVKESGLNGFDDSEIYSLAVHYYVEEGIDPGTREQCRVIVNHHVQLTEEEIAEQKRLAKERLFSQEMERQRTARIPSVRKTVVEDSTGLLFPLE